MNKNKYRWIVRLCFLMLCLTACTDDSVVIGEKPLKRVQAVEDHSDVLVNWAKAGIKDAVIVNIDTHDDIRFIPEKKIAALRNLLNRKDWEHFARANSSNDGGLYDYGNFIYAGAKLGVIKKVYWVIPFKHFVYSKPTEILCNLLRIYGFSEDDIKTFVFQDGCFSGRYQGIPLTLCSLEALPVIKQPILLSVDVDFFPQYVSEHNLTFLQGVQTFFIAFAKQKYRIQDCVVSYSINGYFLKPQLRWVGDYVIDLLKNPTLINSAVPEQYAFKQQVESDIFNGEFATAVAKLNSALSRNADPALLMYLAEAQLSLKQLDHAYVAASTACKSNSLYCYGLPYLGLQLFEKNQMGDAIPFFNYGYTSKLDMNFGQAEYGVALRNLGRYDEALTAFRSYRTLHGSFPADFMMLEVLLRAGREKEAHNILETAITALNQVYYFDVLSNNRYLADVLYSVIAYCRKYGYINELNIFMNSPVYFQLVQKYPAN